MRIAQSRLVTLTILTAVVVGDISGSEEDMPPGDPVAEQSYFFSPTSPKPVGRLFCGGFGTSPL